MKVAINFSRQNNVGWRAHYLVFRNYRFRTIVLVLESKALYYNA